MIRNSEYFEQTDKYLNSEMTLPELKEFEAQMAIDSDLADEVALHLEVEQAIGEHDVVDLRNTLNQIVQNQSENNARTEEMSVLDSFNFGLADEFSFGKNNQLNTENIFNFGNSFPKIHLYQHKIAGKENIHQFYKEQSDPNSLSDDESTFSPLEEELFADIQTALEENDIAELRANLQQVAQSLPAHQYSTEDVDDYLCNLMEPERKAQFEDELAVNPYLAHEVQLIREIDLAASESDIMALRANLNKIQQSEFHASASIEELENYLNNELSDEELASFEAELTSNHKLQEEIDLIKDIDLALAEDDVMRLRNNLQDIAAQIASNKRTERSFAGKFNVRRVITSTVAASVILLLGITGIVSKQYQTGDIYQKFYNKYEVAGAVRSANVNENRTFAMALQKYENQDYKAALSLFGQVIANDPGNVAGHFYSGISLQETGKYQNAIKEYETVLINKDNLFTEQAQWYAGLCLLQTNDNKKAYKQFKKIAASNGFYKQKAQEILKKIKYTD